MVSYLSTSVTLCQRNKYSSFFRTVPSDKHQARAIVALLKRFGWNYASFVHSDSEYGTTGYQLVKQAIEQTGEICLADPLTIYNEQFETDDYKKVVKTLLHGNNETKENGFLKPKVVIVFADRVPAGKLLQAAKDLEVKDKLLWIGSDAWASRESVVENREEFVDGAIAIMPLRRILPAYNEYFKTLITKKNHRNPWFDEYLEVYHQCTNLEEKMDTLPHCREKQALYRDQVYIHFVRDAVYAFAHAVHNLHLDVCGSFDGEHRLCPAFKEQVFEQLVSYIANVSFVDTDEPNYTFRFYHHNDSYSQGPMPHDGPPRYSIINFAKNQDLYDWNNVGTYVDGEIIDIEEGFAASYAPKARVDACSRKECVLNEIKILDTDDKCCWHCVNCTSFQKRINEYECRDCKPGERSQINLDNETISCVLIEEVSISF